MKVGVVVGSFDLLHVGHLCLLEYARAQCDRLIVGVNRDDVIIRDKHHKPMMNECDRLAILRAVRFVDDAILVDDNAVQFIADLCAGKMGQRPDYYIRGDEPNKPHIAAENEKIRALGVDVLQIKCVLDSDTCEKTSSSVLKSSCATS